MKTRFILCGLMLAAAFPFPAGAGTLFYVPIPAAGSDAKSGLDPQKKYTSAISAGDTRSTGRRVNGVPFVPLAGTDNAATAGGVTISAATGSLLNGGGKSETVQADGAMAEVLSTMIFNDGARDNSEQYVVLDPATLTVGSTYDLRVYICNASGENRQVNLTFAGDGKAAVSTDFFNEDDATTSSGGFAEPNQAYYINYRFTWDGASTPGFTATQRFGSTPFCLYALTNQEVGGDAEARPAGAIVAAPPEPIATPPVTSRRSRTNLVNEDIGVSSEVFYESDSLRRHGHWVTVGSYGRCWHPSNVDDNWQPYTRGHWVYSYDDGWVWDSDEDFGWATYHYGRWFREEGSGWYWVPGRVWAPAWVSWRHGHSYIGWAPLPPLAIATAGIGIGIWADHRWGMGPDAYSFVNARDFGARSMSPVILPQQQNVVIMSNTTNVTNIVTNQSGIFNGGPNFQAVNNTLLRAGAQPVPTVQVNRHASAAPVTPDGKFSNLSAGVLAVAAPVVTPNKKSAPPLAATIAKPKIDKGWNGLHDPSRAATLQAKIAGETPGQAAKTAPARLPGAIPVAPTTAVTKGTSPLKPFRPSKTTDATPLVKPGQPASPVVVAPPQPGQPVKPTETPRIKPGKPGKPASPVVVTPPQPGQPVQPVETPRIKPGKPAAPVVVTPPQPGQPVQPVETPRIKPGKPGKPASPVVVAPPQPVPTAVAKPAAPATPTPEPVRPKIRTPKITTPVPAPPVPVKPSVPAPTVPEPARPPKRVATPAPAPVKPVAPIPQPAPVARPTPRPAPPAPVAPPAPIARPAPRPAPVIVAPPKPQPPAPVPARPVAPPAPAAPPAKGGKPTPTPAPGVNG